MKLVKLRRYARLTYEAQNVTARMSYVWKFLRSYPVFLNKTYKRIALIAIKRGLLLPRPHIDMDIEED